jgi:restriction endonuclease S subunit
VIDVRDGTHDTPVKIPDGIPLVTSKNLKDEGIDFSDVTFISEEAHREIEKRSRVDDRDIIFAMIRTIGNPVIVKKGRPFSIKNIALFKLGSSAVYPEYFKHLLSTNFIIRQLENSTRGGSQKFVSLQVLRNLIIPLPPIEQQKRIAAILDKAEEQCIIAHPGEETWAFDSHIMRIRFDRNFTEPEFIRHLFMTEGGRSLFLSASRKSTVQFNINTKEIAALKIPVPTVTLQQEFAQRIETIESLKAKHRESLTHLDTLFASLQHRAFRGEL